MSTFVFIAGAFHGSWCWQRVVPALEARGHRVMTPDLTGTNGQTAPADETSLAAWADEIADLLRAEPEPVILVGHSRGGLVISEVAERVPERIASLAYLSAFLLGDGETLVGAYATPPSDDEAAAGTIIPDAEGRGFLDQSAVQTRFYNCTEPAWVDLALSRIAVEPLAAFFTPVRVSAGRFGSVRRAYIECTQDLAVPLTLQRAMQTRLPCNPVCTLQTDHSPFFSNPDELVGCLLAIAREANTEPPVTGYASRAIA